MSHSRLRTRAASSPDPGVLGRVEDVLLASVTLALVALPVAEIVLRASGTGGGIVGIGGLVQHLTLVIGMLGAGVAAREGRLLALSIAPREPAADRWPVRRVLVNALAVLVSGLLAAAAVDYLRYERDSAVELAFGIPAWWVQCAVPLGFGIIALRLFWQAAPGAGGRIGALAAAGLMGATLLWAPVSDDLRLIAGFLVLTLATALGAPIFVAIGGAAMLLMAHDGLPLAVIALNHVELTTNPSLPAIPLFTAAGYVLAESGAPQRLIAVFHSLLGRSHRAAAVVTVVACAFFTSFTGASGVTILALGGLLLPLLLSAGVRERRALGLITGAGAPGVLLPPSLPVILYAAVAQASLEEMFLAGLLPALLLLAVCALWGTFGRAVRPETGTNAVAPVRPWLAMNAAKWELALPVGVLVVLLGGFATPVETAAVTAAAAIFIEVVIHRDLHPLRDLPGVLAACGLLVGGILLVLGVAMGLTNTLIDAEIPDRALVWVTGYISSPWLFLLALNAFLLAVGFLMDIYSAIVVLVPLLVPLGEAFGIPSVHLAMVFLANLQLGYLTPPVGMNLFFASYRFERPIVEIYGAVWPLFLALLVAVLAITYLPFLSTWLPGTLR